MNKIFEPTQQIRIKDLKELNMEQLLSETYAIKSIHVESPTDSVTFQMVSVVTHYIENAKFYKRKNIYLRACVTAMYINLRKE